MNQEPIPAHKRARMALREGFASPNRHRGEGRWFALSFGNCSPEEHAVASATLLLRRYGMVCRDLAQMCRAMPPWKHLLEVLNRMELCGEIRRGYFVEGFHGAQFALPEALSALHEEAIATPGTEPVIVLHSMDPANLYGSGAPLDLALLDGGIRPFPRKAGSWIALKAGLPRLLVEKDGRKITLLPTASPMDVAEAIEALKRPMLAIGKGRWTVESINEKPACGTERSHLEGAGFVSDHLFMTLYGTIQS